MFMLPLFALLRRMTEPIPFHPLSFLLQKPGGSVIIFVKRGLSFSELSASSLSSLDPCSDCVGVGISLDNSSSLSFLDVYAPPPPVCSSLTDGRTDSFSPSILPSCRGLFILGDFGCQRPLWNSEGTFNPRGEEVFDWVVSSDLLPLGDPDTPAPSASLHWQSLLSWRLLCSLLSGPFLLLGGASGPGF